jgi:restriction endonuclease S subunit/predicted GIY-YIG superfamily endonuclease
MIFNKSKYNINWDTLSLEDLGTFKRGKSKHRPRNDSKLFENGIYPLVQTGEIKEANLYLNKHSINYNEFGLSQSKLWPKNTLCITIAANIAETAILNYPMCFPDSIVGFNSYSTKSDVRFVYYIFEYVKRSIQNAASGSIQDNINIDFLTKLKFKTPKLETQSQIAKVLSDLDAKIELNNKINAELEAMAKLIYDYWFVQFEFPCLPHDYRPSGQVNPNNELSEKIRAFCTYKQTGGLPLPDGKKWFVYVLLCEDGSFYKGMTNDLYRRYYEHKTGQGAEHTKVHKPRKVIHWEVFPSQSEAAVREKELKTGFGRTWLQREYEYLQKNKPGSPAHQNERLSKLIPAGKMVWNVELKREVPEGWEVKELGEMIQIFDSQRIPISSRDRLNRKGIIPYYGATSIMDYIDDFIFDDEYILMAEDGSVMNEKGLPIVQFIWGKTWVNNHAHVIQAKNKSNNEFYFQQIKMIPVVLIKTGSIQMKINQENLKKYRVLTPPEHLISKYSLTANSFRKELINKIEENQKLVELRDWLLPMLMNGQVRVDKLSEP